MELKVTVGPEVRTDAVVSVRDDKHTVVFSPFMRLAIFLVFIFLYIYPERNAFVLFGCL